MNIGTRIKVAAAMKAAGFAPAARRHALVRIEQALLVYHADSSPRSVWGATVLQELRVMMQKAGRGRPRNRRLEALLQDLAVQFHVALPDRPGVAKHGARYYGEFVTFAERVLAAAGIKPAVKDLGSLIYRAVRNDSQIHGELDTYPETRSKRRWQHKSDIAR